MDTFITVILWLGGFYALFILALSIGFSAGGYAQTDNIELGIISAVSTFLFLFLIYLGISSITSYIFPSEENTTQKVVTGDQAHKTTVATEKKELGYKIKKSEESDIDFVVYFLYLLMLLPIPMIGFLFYRKFKKSTYSESYL